MQLQPFSIASGLPPGVFARLPKQAQAAVVILQRREARRDLTRFAEIALKPSGFAPAAHHRLLLRHLQSVVEGKTRKLMVFMPPGSAKSTYTSTIFPPWFMAQRRDTNVIGASHTASLAERFSKKTQDVVRENSLFLGYQLKSEAVTSWTTTRKNEYRAAGVGAGIAGFRADLGVIDDPFPSRAEAESKLQRDKVWDWYRSDFSTRLKPGASQVLVMTRWHEDDLAGRLLASEPDEWTLIKLRAQAIEGEDDPLGRAPGEFLWGDDSYGYGGLIKEALATYERTGGMRDWYSLYQQDPRPMSGALFQTAKISVIPAPPAGGTMVRAWDLAATKQVGTANPDWTVGVLMQRAPDDRYIVRDVVRFRGGPEDVERTILATATRDGRTVKISIPQDPGQAGKVQVAILAKKLAGFPVESSTETGDKATRAAPFASQVNMGNVDLVTAPWNVAYVDELGLFPSGAKDDQVDASSRAFGVLAPTDDAMRRFRAMT